MIMNPYGIMHFNTQFQNHWDRLFVHSKERYPANVEHAAIITSSVGSGGREISDTVSTLQTNIGFLTNENTWEIGYSEILIFDNGLLTIDIDLMPDDIHLLKARTDLLKTCNDLLMGDINFLSRYNRLM